MKEKGEKLAVRLISVHDGLSLFRRFSVIHPSLISSFKIVFGQLHKAPQGHWLPFKKENKFFF